MIEPIRDQLDAGLQSDRAERDERWTQALEAQIKDTEVGIESQLASATISLRQLINLKAGDVLPIQMPKTVDLYVEDMPVFRGEFGISRGRNAVRITDIIRRPAPHTPTPVPTPLPTTGNRP